jgi:4-hydroxy-tetrahydrodipicolinate synthase
MLPDTVLRLAKDCENIVAIKEASGDMKQVEELIASAQEGFEVISGDDFTALQTVMAGGIGFISVLGQGLPREFSEMIRLGLSGKSEKADALHLVMKEGMELIFREGNPAGIKSLLEFLGLMRATVRLPLVEASPELKSHIGNFMKKYANIHA